MNKRFWMAVVTFSLFAGIGSADVFDDLATYEYGASTNVADEAFKKLNDTPVAQHAAIEIKLIAVVSNKGATETGKAFACRMLQQLGSEKCIPAVGGLLEHEVLAGYARLVLERMAGSEKAAAALLAGLEKAPDKAKVGILASLGEIRHGQAVEPVAKLAKSRNTAVASSAMMALGKIGNREAANSLENLTPGDALKQAYLDALIACANRLGGSEAASLYRKAIASKHGAHHVAAMQGLATVDAKAGAAMIADALKGDDAVLRKGALGAVVAVKGEALTRAMTTVLDDLPTRQKAELIAALGSRGDKTALVAIGGYVKSELPIVQDAAIAAAGALGNDGTVDALLELAASDGVEYQVMTAISRMRHPKTDDALIRALSGRVSRTVAIQTLAARNCTAAAPKLLELVHDPDAKVRSEVWSALGTLGGERDMAAAMKAVVKIEDGKELRQAQDAIKRIYSGVSDKGSCFALISGSYETASDAIRSALLELGAVAGSNEALGLVRKALKSESKDLRKDAIRALASWPNTAAAQDLYGLATSAEDQVDRILGLRGYIAIAASDRINIPGAERMKMFDKAAGLVTRVDEKRLIISGLQRSQSTGAFGMLLEYMKDADVKREAEMAAANLLWETKDRKSAESQDIARMLLESKDKAVRDKAGSVVSEWSKFKSYLTSWMVTGLFNEKGKSGADVFKKVFPPETNDAGVKWTRLEKGIGRETINFDALFGHDKNQCCAYVKTVIDSPADQPARLELGSDDGIKAWLNGKLVHANWASRGCTPGQDTAKVSLKKGRNELMLKIVDEASHWAFSCRLRGENGMPIEGLKASAE